MPMHQTDMAALGALVRAHREARKMTMDQLAKAARISARSIHRIEHGPGDRAKGSVKHPTASNLARVLLALGLDRSSELGDVLGDEPWASEVRYWMEHAPAEEVRDYVRETSASMFTPGQPDLVLLHEGGAVAVVQFRTGRTLELVRELAEVLRGHGYMVTAPT